jgi:hypothetical protein
MNNIVSSCLSPWLIIINRTIYSQSLELPRLTVKDYNTRLSLQGMANYLEEVSVLLMISFGTPRGSHRPIHKEEEAVILLRYCLNI